MVNEQYSYNFSVIYWTHIHILKQRHRLLTFYWKLKITCKNY